METNQNTGSHGDATTSGGEPRKPCRTCTDFQSWMKMQSGKGKHKTAPPSSVPSDAGAEASPTPTAAAVRTDCPLDSAALGRSGWSLLHTVAAHYPDRPDSTQRTQMSDFIRLFSQLYPCSHCAEDFRQDIAENPPSLESGASLSRWFCERHNTVNHKLSRPEFDCDLVDQRWKDGWKDGSCG